MKSWHLKLFGTGQTQMSRNRQSTWRIGENSSMRDIQGTITILRKEHSQE